VDDVEVIMGNHLDNLLGSCRTAATIVPAGASFPAEVHVRIITIALRMDIQDLPVLARVSRLYAKVTAAVYGRVIRKQSLMYTSFDYDSQWIACGAVDINNFTPDGALVATTQQWMGWCSLQQFGVISMCKGDVNARSLKVRVGAHTLRFISVKLDPPADPPIYRYVLYQIGRTPLGWDEIEHSVEIAADAIRVVSAVYPELAVCFHIGS
jgi:hypothetical protein